MGRARDSQRSKIYKAERSAFNGLLCDELHELNVEECQDFIDEVYRSAWFEKRYGPHVIPTVRAGQGARSAMARYHSKTITLPKWARKRWVILHEIAHFAVYYVHNDSNHNNSKAAHGREFAKEYLALIKRWVGAEEAKALKASFKEHRVKSRVG